MGRQSKDLLYCSGQYKVESDYIAAVVDLVIQVLSTNEGNFQFRIRGVPGQSARGVPLVVFQGHPRQGELSTARRDESRIFILGTSRQDSNGVQGQGLRGRLCLKRVSMVPG